MRYDNKGIVVGVIVLIIFFAAQIVIINMIYNQKSDSETVSSTEDELRTGKEIERDYLFKEEKIKTIPDDYSEEALLDFVSGEDGEPFQTEVVKISDDTSKITQLSLKKYLRGIDEDFATLLTYIVNYANGKDFQVSSVSHSQSHIHNCIITCDGVILRFVTGKPNDVSDDSIKIYIYNVGD